MMRTRCALLLLLLLNGSLAAANDTERAVIDDRERPRIGLVLGGGGAKGAAHIGILKVLEELRVPVDCIAGSSMGALLGGTYATGASAAHIEQTVLDINWSKTVGGAGLRDMTPINAKLNGQNSDDGLELGIGRDGISTPSGLIPSQQIEDVIRNLVLDARYTRDFDDLPIPFRAIATDVVSGDMVVLEQGDLSVAMRASMAIPGAFAPVERNGQVLVDGGITRNLPVDVARELCADVIIAVWFESTPPTAEDLASPVAIARRALDVMVIANERQQIGTLDDDDVAIGVFVGDIGVSDFLRTDEAIGIGYEAADRFRESLSRYSLEADDYAEWQASVSRRGAPEVLLSAVSIRGLERVNPAYVRAQLENVAPGVPARLDAISADIDRVFALGDFERVSYRLTGPENRTLEIRPVEKRWGPDFLTLDFGLATNGDEDPRALVRADHRRTWINRRGGQWHNAIQIGQRSLFATDFYQPLDIEQRYFLQPILNIETSLEDIYVDEDRIARYFFRQRFIQLDAGRNFGTRAQLRAGLQRRYFATGLDTGLPGLPEEDGNDVSAQFRFIYDTRDDVRLPTDGTYVDVLYRHSLPWVGEEDYRLVEGVLTRAFNLQGNSLSLIIGGGDTIDGAPPVTDEIQLGGIRTFPGLRRGELRGREYWFAGTTYLWRLADLQPLFGQSLYAGLRVSAGDVNERFDGIDDGTLFGIAASLRGRTPLGSFLLSLGYVNNDSLRLQFSLGRSLDEGSLLDGLY